MKKPRGLFRKALPWIFLSPMLIMIAIFWLSPIAITIFLSLTNINSIRNFKAFICGEAGAYNYTLANFYKVFMGGDPYMVEVAKITLLYVGSVLIINAFYSLILSIAVAFLIRNELLSIFLRLTWLLPRITPAVVYGFMWIWLVSPDVGPLYQLFKALGIAPSSWILEKPYSQLLMIMINGFVGVSFGMIIYTSAIKSIPEDFIRAARVDGASDFQIARRIILPLLRWPMLFVVSWQTLSLIASYEYILIVWGEYGATRAAGTTVFPLYAWFRAFDMNEYSYGAAVSLVILVMGLSLLLIYFKVFGFSRLMQPTRIEV